MGENVFMANNLESKNWFIIRNLPIKDSRSISDISHAKHHVHTAAIQGTNTYK